MEILGSRRISVVGSKSRLGFTTTGGGSWKVWDRFLSVDGEPVMHIGNVCGTCSFFFVRKAEHGKNLEVEQLVAALRKGITKLGAEADTFSTILPSGDYLACLFKVQPQLVGPNGARDYFTCEMEEAWGREPDDSQPASGYYRAGDFVVGKGERFFEFVIPIQLPQELDQARVAEYVQEIREGNQPTAVAVGVLDVKNSEEWPEEDGQDIEPEFPTHWCLANYLLDGHHKIMAASMEQKPITLLSFVTVEHSWKQVERLPKVYAAK